MTYQYKRKHKESFRRIHYIVVKNSVLRKVCELLYPPRCPFCDAVLDRSEQETGYCRMCAGRLPWVRGSVCMKCGKPVKYQEQEYCPDCAGKHHVFDQGVAAFTYSGCMPSSVHRMKSCNRRDYLDFFAAAMAGACSRRLASWKPEVILAVPMHPSRRAARGYNQSELLAEKISVWTGIPADLTALVCVRKTKTQKTLSRKERQANLRGSFAVRRSFLGVSGVLVVDDVYTTGSTMDEIAEVLKAAGVSRVYFLVLCIGKGKN